MLPTLLTLLTIAFVTFAIFSWQNIKRLERALARNHKLEKNRKLRKACALVNWSWACCVKSLPRPLVRVDEFESYTLAYNKFHSETDHLATEVIDFTNKWLVDSELFNKEGNIKECLEEARALVENMEETIDFHEGIMDKYNLAAVQISDKFEPITIVSTVRRTLRTAKKHLAE